MKHIPYLSIVVAALILVSCASLSQPADPWVGATKDQLVQQMGNPNSSISDGHGGEILVYIVSNYTVISPPQSFRSPAPRLQAFQPGSQVWIPPHTGTSDQYIEINKFFVDPTGKIYKHEELVF